MNKRIYTLGESCECAVCECRAAVKVGIVVRGKMVIFPACHRCADSADVITANALLQQGDHSPAKCETPECDCRAVATIGVRRGDKIYEFHLCEKCTRGMREFIDR